MSNKFRYVRGDTQGIKLPKYASDAIEIGDLLFWDATNNAARPASQISGADYATQKTNLAAAFIGVAAEAKAANVSGNLTVYTAGDYVFAAPSGVGTDYDVTNPLAGGDGSEMKDQTLVKDTTSGNAIARVIAAKTTSQAYVTCRLLSRTSVSY